MAGQPGRLIAQGRDADIFEHGPCSVLRRSRKSRPLVVEARIMELARTQGYPVPAVEQVSDDGLELVMERVDGPSMMEELGSKPWQMGSIARQLADLHKQLHEISPPEWVDPDPIGGTGGDVADDGRALLHFDLHPLNVIMSSKGPVVIDWARAAAGPPELDVDATWVVLAAAGIPAGRMRATVMGPLRSIFVRGFIRHFDEEVLRARLADVVAWKVQDENMTPAECAAMWRMVGGSPAGGGMNG